VYRAWLVIALLLVVVVPTLDLDPVTPPPPEPAARPGLLPPPPPPTLEPDYRDAVFGDFRLAGNSALRCPLDGEESGGGDPGECAAATANDGGGGGLLDAGSNNGGYYMHLADVDGRAETFTSSTAAVDIPAGASVRHAALHWGGHTGRFIGFSGVNCVRPLLLQGEPPPPPAAPTPAEQQVSIAVGGGAPVQVPRDPDNLRTTGGLTEPSEIYTDWADVTALFDSAPVSGGPLEITVGNVWTPTGPGCAAGWSIVVVFGYDEPVEAYPLPRVVDLYTDDLPASGALLPGLIEPLVPGFPSLIDDLLPGLVPALTGSSVILPGITPLRSTADIAIGVTAYDGDWRQGGERFSVDNTAITEPCLGDSAEDFFRSCALGAVDPLDPDRGTTNNMSVDAKVVRPQLSDNETGEIEVAVDSVVDFVVLQNLVLAETVTPVIGITNTGPAEPVRQGDLATFAVEVRNDGGLPLSDIELTHTSDPEAGPVRCTPEVIAPLLPGQSRQVTCVQAAGGVDFTNTATVSGTYLLGTGGDRREVTASASAEVAVVAADYAVERVPDRLVVRAGEPVEFTVRLINNTDTELTGVEYADGVATCPAPPAALAPRSTEVLVCTAIAPAETFTSSGQLTGVDPLGETVVVTSQEVTVRVIDPAITLVQDSDKDVIYRGDSVTFTFTATNTGTDPDESLVDVRVTAEALPGCETEPVAELPPGASAEFTCTTSPARTVEVLPEVTAVDSAGGPVTAAAEPRTITVLDPLIKLTQRVDRPTVRVGEEIVVTFAVEHVGTAEDGPVTDVRIASPTLPPDCLPEAVPQLAPGESAERTCAAAPDRSFDNRAEASAVDVENRLMRAAAAPLRVTVINPALTISATAEQAEVKHGAEIDFGVTVRNIGDVPLTLAVTNDLARDCDFAFTGQGLRPGAANAQYCKATAPTDESAADTTNTATFTADPTPATGDTGDPITGSDDAVVTLLPGQAPPGQEPGTDPVTGGGGGGDGGGGSSDSGSDSGGSSGGSDPDLAETGASVAIPIGLGISLVLLGSLALLATSHRRHREDGFLARWWPTN
jgi:hypothetical protein